jgi:hypothetical protein
MPRRDMTFNETTENGSTPIGRGTKISFMNVYVKKTVNAADNGTRTAGLRTLHSHMKLPR